MVNLTLHRYIIVLDIYAFNMINYDAAPFPYLSLISVGLMINLSYSILYVNFTITIFF